MRFIQKRAYTQDENGTTVIVRCFRFVATRGREFPGFSHLKFRFNALLLSPSLARHLQKVQSAASADFTEDQKVFIHSINLCTHQFGCLYRLKVFDCFFL